MTGPDEIEINTDDLIDDGLGDEIRVFDPATMELDLVRAVQLTKRTKPMDPAVLYSLLIREREIRAGTRSE